MERLADASKSFNMTIWFGHHPFSVTTTPYVRKILRWVTRQHITHLHSFTCSVTHSSVWLIHSITHRLLKINNTLNPDQLHIHSYVYFRTGGVYLCGHLHTLAGVVPKMHAVHVDGHLELELGDWLDTRKWEKRGRGVGKFLAQWERLPIFSSSLS